MPTADGRGQQLPHGFSIRLQAVYETLKSAERKAADLLIEQPELVASSSISDAAHAAGCSEPTLTRLARKLGFSGFSDLKAELVTGMQQHAMPMRAEKLSGNPEQILAEVLRSSVRSLTDTLSVIDTQAFSEAVEALRSARHIVFLGTGEAWAISLIAQYRFTAAGFHCTASCEADMQLMTATALRPGDVCLIFSYSGRSRPMVAAARRARNAGATVISVTNFPVSPLAKQTSVLLLSAAFDEHIEGDVTSRRLAQVAILDALFVATILASEESVRATCAANREIIEASKQ